MHCSSDIHSGGEGQIIKYKYPVKGAYTAASACPCILTPVITGLWAIVAINVSHHDDLPQFFRSCFFFFLNLLAVERTALRRGGLVRRCTTSRRNKRRSARLFPSVNSRDQSADASQVVSVRRLAKLHLTGSRKIAWLMNKVILYM